MPTLSNDEGDHESAMPAPATATVRDADVLRPTEIVLCKYMRRATFPVFGSEFPLLLGRERSRNRIFTGMY